MLHPKTQNYRQTSCLHLLDRQFRMFKSRTSRERLDTFFPRTLLQVFLNFMIVLLFYCTVTDSFTLNRSSAAVLSGSQPFAVRDSVPGLSQFRNTHIFKESWICTLYVQCFSEVITTSGTKLILYFLHNLLTDIHRYFLQKCPLQQINYG